MPAGQPFTLLCQSLARPRHFGRVDLHLHTTYSDGAYAPREIVDLAHRSGLSAIAVTDHDTLAGIAPTRQAAGAALEVINGVEITAEYLGKELHLLGYFVQLDHAPLNLALEHLRHERVGRFHAMIERLGVLGVHFEAADLAHLGTATTLGRRHLAEMLVQAKKSATIREAFQRYLGDHGRAAVTKTRLPVSEAIALVRGANGVAAWAHPTYDCSKETLRELQRMGLAAVEAEYPAFRDSRRKELRQWAQELGLAVTGGSDCHGPDRPLAAGSITHGELEHLRSLI